MAGYRWKPIEDLPDDWPKLCSTELESLSSIWKEQSASLLRSDALKQFNVRLRREWAIETGIIENLYQIDIGITRLLIEKGIEASLIPFGASDRPAERIVPILKDQEDVLEGLFEFVARKRDLSTSYIKELHQALTRHQETVEAVNGLGRLVNVPLLRGEWKRHPNNPTRPNGELHEYCPPEHVASEMDRLVEIHKEHAGKGVPPEVESSWLHHRFTQIHPFRDGNGRIARALASLVFLRAGWFPMIIHRDERKEYIDSLEAADNGDLSKLVDLFSSAQKKAFNKALSLSEDILLERKPLEQLISAAKSLLSARKLERVTQMQSEAFRLSSKLERVAEEKLETVASTLSRELGEIDRSYWAATERNNDKNCFWFKRQIVEVARDLGYYADTRTYSAWVRLKIREDRLAELVLSFHAMGVTFLGIMAVSAFIEYKDKGEDGEATLEGPHRICKEPFQFSYKEPEHALIERFNRWLEDVLLGGLDLWRRQL